MFLAGHIYTPTSNGNPTHKYCGQGSSLVSFTNLSLNIAISKGNSGVTSLVNTNDLSTLNLSGLSTGTVFTYGDLDIVFNSFYYFALTGTYVLGLDFFRTGTTEVVTHEKINVSIDIAQNGYISYHNVFEVYGYDIGNDTFLGLSGNKDFDIYLIPTSNFDSNGNQQDAFSNLVVLRRPFTNEAHVYSLVATQGTYTYYKTSDATIVYGNTPNLNLCLTGELDITQKIKLTLGDTCTKDYIDANVIWLPTITNTTTCTSSCGDGCVVNTNSEVNTVVDYTNVSIFKLYGVSCFLTEFMYHDIRFEQYSSDGTLVNTQESQYTITEPLFIATPATYLVPVNYTFTLTAVGDNIIKAYSIFYIDSNKDIELINCYEAIAFSSCNFWTIDKTGTCGSYQINNWKSHNITVTISSLQDDKTWLQLSTSTISALSNTIITLATNGIYLITITSTDIVIVSGDIEDIDTIQYYTIANFCNLENCWLDYLNKVICCKPKDNCQTKDQYDFFALMINAHTFFMALNDEFNFNFIYTSLGDLNNRLDTLFTLSSFIKRFDEYCSDCKSDCLPCNETVKRCD